MSKNYAFTSEIGIRRQNAFEEDTPYRWEAFTPDEVNLITEAIHAIAVIAWQQNIDEPHSPKGCTNNKVSATVEAFQRLARHRNHPGTQSIIKDLLRKLAIPLYKTMARTERVEIAIHRLLQERIKEKNELANAEPIEGMDVEAITRLVDAQIQQLREVIQASRSWFTSATLERAGVNPGDCANDTRKINPDWHLPPLPTPDNKTIRSRITGEERHLSYELENLAAAKNHIMQVLTETNQNKKEQATLTEDLVYIEKRIKRIEKSLEREKRIRGYAERRDT